MRRKESFHSFFGQEKKEEGGVCLPSWQTKLKPTDGSSIFWGGEGERRNGRRKNPKTLSYSFLFKGDMSDGLWGPEKKEGRLIPALV